MGSQGRPGLELVRATSDERGRAACPVQLRLQYCHVRSASYVNPRCELPTFTGPPLLLTPPALPRWLPAPLHPAWRRLTYQGLWGRSRSCSYLLKREVCHPSPSRSEGCLFTLLVSRRPSPAFSLHSGTTLQAASVKDIRYSHFLTIPRPCRSLANMASVTPPRTQHSLKASTLPQTARPPTRKPRGLKAFWRRLSQSPKPEERDKKDKEEKFRPTVSVQSLEVVVGSSRGCTEELRVPTNSRKGSGHTPEKRRSGFGAFFSAFTHGKQSKENKQNKNIKTKTDVKNEVSDNNLATTPGSQGNGQLRLDFKNIPATTVPSLSPQHSQSITTTPRVCPRTSTAASTRPHSTAGVTSFVTTQLLPDTQSDAVCTEVREYLGTPTKYAKSLDPTICVSGTNGRPISLNLPASDNGIDSTSSCLLVTATMPAIVPAHPAESSTGWLRATSRGGEVRNAVQHHRTQPSLDTIGSCSLDVQATTATSPTGADLIDDSEGTLRSISFDQHKTLVRETSRSGRGAVRSPPSYLSIACAVSGYSSINRYDSAVREGFRSRDNSPAPPRLVFARSRDSSPLGSRLKSPESKCTPQETALRIKELKAQLARCAQELGGQLDDRSRQGSIRRRDKKPPSGRSVSVDRGYLTKASLINTGASQGYSEDRLRYLDSSPRHTAGDGARNGYSSGNMTSHQVPVRLIETQQKFNGHLHTPLTTLHSRAIDNTIEETRSFIQERIERLYGPGALAAGFIRRTPSHGVSNSVVSGMGNTFRRSLGGVQDSGEGRIIPIQLEYDETDNSQGLPSVFRHLRPEFRHQLPVKSPVSSASKAVSSKRADSAETNGHAVSAAGVTSHGSSPTRLAASAVPTPLEAITSGPDYSVQSNGRHGGDTTAATTKLSCSLTSVADDTPSCCGVLTSTAASAPHNGCGSSIPRNKVVPSAEQTTPTVTAAVGTDGSSTTTSGEVVKDGHYYLKVVASEVSSLEAEVAALEAELEQHSAAMTEDLRGKVFAATGKTKLLISQKIKQFTGLCHKNIAGQQGTDEFPTTDMDLAGFWDMVSLQVLDVRGLLQQLRDVRDNGWKEVSASPVPAPTSAKPRRVKAVAAPVDKAKEEARKKAAEDRRKALREAMKAKRAAAAAEGGGDSEEVAIFVPDS